MIDYIKKSPPKGHYSPLCVGYLGNYTIFHFYFEKVIQWRPDGSAIKVAEFHIKKLKNVRAKQK